MVTDQIADLLTRIRNGLAAGHPAVAVPASSVKERVINLLVEEGYLAGAEKGEDASGKPQLKAFLRYDDRGDPVIREIKRVSRPGKRIYVGRDSIPRSRGGLGVVIVSTSQGLMSDQRARQLGVGGEVICSVF